ncbi:unnamed protein product, partial [Mesorhabditis belari]|uniref:Innexin n=1 Tax=Mesorhabditis belari TaxID=2138241 RepID=A0AAF3FLD1_9BILA
MKCIVAGKPAIWQGFYNEYCFTQGRFQIVDDASNSPNAFVPVGFADFFVRNFQWMPYLFILQLVLFAIPKCAWTAFALSFKNVNQTVSAISQARCIKSLKGEERMKEVEAICEFCCAVLDLHKKDDAAYKVN